MIENRTEVGGLRTEAMASVLSTQSSVLPDASRITHHVFEDGAEGQNRTVDTSLFRASEDEENQQDS